MSTITPYDYHNDSANHGNYQYVSLKNMVDEFELDKLDDDNILKNTKRTVIIEHIKRGIRKLNKKVFKDIRAIAMTVPENLYFVLPHNFVDWVRVSVIVEDTTTDSYRLKPLNINKGLNVSIGYLQDHDAEILFDSNGLIITTDAQNAYASPYKKYTFDTGAYVDTSKYSKYGEFKIDKVQGQIVFSSDLGDEEVVLEYLTDGLQWDTYADEAIKVHKNMIDVLRDWSYYSIINRKKNVDATTKRNALLRYKTTLHEAKIDASDFSMLEINRVININSKM